MSSQTEHRAAYSDDEWELLTELPDLVIIAATSAEHDGARQTINEGLAGDRGVESGRRSESSLVRAVVAELWTDDDTPGPQPAAVEFNDPAKGIADVLEKSRRVAALLRAKADPADAQAYLRWLWDTAEQVCAASRSGGFLGVGGVQISPTERRFLDDLDRAFHG